MAHGGTITKEAAKTLIDKYQDSYPNQKKAHLYDASLIQSLLDETGVEGVRIYHGQQTNGDQVLILVGTDSDEKDLTDGTILEFGSPCPTTCDATSYFA